MERAAVPGMIRDQRLNQWIKNYSDLILRTCFLYLSRSDPGRGCDTGHMDQSLETHDDFERKQVAVPMAQNSEQANYTYFTLKSTG